MKQTYLSVVFSAFVVLGVLGLVMPHSAEAAKSAGIGYINIQKVFSSHPDMEGIRAAIKLEQQKGQQDFAENAKSLPEKEKAAYADQLNKKIAEKEQSLLKPLQKKITRAIEKVAKEQGIDSIVNAGIMIYGGRDLTEDVIKAAQ